jgi:hypothetical protein
MNQQLEAVKATQCSTKRFSLGEIVATPGALSVLEKSGQPPLLFLIRHARGD